MRIYSHSRGLRFRLSAYIVLILVIQGLSACTKKDGATSSTPEASQKVDIVARGKSAYMSHCIMCHNVNPKNAGSIGPEVWGSSRELLEAKIIHANYPAGYKPKRETQAMVPIPGAKDEIDALYAFLNHTE